MKKLILVLTMFISLIGYANEKNNENEFTFFKEPYINPRIISDMTTMLSDTGDQVIAINLSDSQNSNRYYGDYNIRKSSDNFPYVEYDYGESDCGVSYGDFAYKYIGKLNSGLEVIETFENGGGSLTFRKLLFIQILKEKGITFDTENQKFIYSDERILIYKVGSVSSMWYKDIKIINGELQMTNYSERYK